MHALDMSSGFYYRAQRMSPSKNPFVMVRLDTALKALLDRVARQERRPVSDIVRQLIIKYLRERGEEIPDPPPVTHEDRE